MTTSSAISSETAILDRYLRQVHAAREHEKGNTLKVLRYRLPTGAEIAVERRKGTPKLYIAESLLPAHRCGPLELQIVAACRDGRNSNLNALDSFRDHSLLALRVETLNDVDTLIGAMI